MSAIQGVDEVSSREWTGLVRRPKDRRPWWIALAVLVVGGLATATWWIIEHGWPEHQIREDSRAVRTVELPDGFDPAPLACPGATLVCAWTELRPEEASSVVREALAESGIDLPAAHCGVGTPVFQYGLATTQPATASGVCSTSAPRHGVTLGILARDEVPMGERDGAPIRLQGTLVTVGWHYESSERSVPGSYSFGDYDVLLGPEEIEALPISLDDAYCVDDCLGLDYRFPGNEPPVEKFWEVATRILDAGVLVYDVTCQAPDLCSLTAYATRTTHPGESLRLWLRTGDDNHSNQLVLSFWGWN